MPFFLYPLIGDYTIHFVSIDLELLMIQMGRQRFGLSALYTPNLLIKGLDKMLGFASINDFVENPEIASLEALPFFDKTLEHFGLTSRFDKPLSSVVGETGAQIIVCNHPTGLAEIITLSHEVLRIRSDLKIVANAMLGNIKPVSSIVLLTDVFKKGMQQENSNMLKAALKHLKAGGLLLIFPAGEISHLHHYGIADGPWSYTPLWLAKMSGASVVCLHADSLNHNFFYRLRKINQRLSTALIGRALYSQKGKPVCYRSSTVINFNRLPDLSKDEASEYLRSLTYSMQEIYPQVMVKSPDYEPLAINPDTAVLEQELACLSPLLQQKQFSLYLTESSNIPNFLVHLGIERERAFRQTGIGTGTSMQVDEFDESSLHLILWDNQEKRLVGAYRFCIIHHEEEIEKLSYMATRYTYTRPLKHGVIELSRAFVTEPYQRTYKALLLLLRGVARTIHQQKTCRYVIGTTSLSAVLYPDIVVKVVGRFVDLMAERQKEPLLTPMDPYHPLNLSWALENCIKRSNSFEEIETLTSCALHCKLKLPPLMRAYESIGAKVLGTSFDHDYGSSLDVLTCWDLAQDFGPQLKIYFEELYTEAKEHFSSLA
jgi:putative hemolysin